MTIGKALWNKTFLTEATKEYKHRKRIKITNWGSSLTLPDKKSGDVTQWEKLAWHG